MKKVFFITLFFFSFSTLFSSEVKKSTLKEQLESLNKLWKTKNDYIFFLNEKTHLKSEVELIQLHLSLVEKHLRKEKVNHLSFEQKENRIKCLNILNLYCKQGVFPKNIYHKERTPYFIDPLGTPCAVGKLIISTGFESFAKTIASENNYGYVKDLNIQYSELSQWAKTNGFKIEELAWIQPTYASDPKYYPMSCNTSCTPTGTQVTSSFIAPDSIISKYKIENNRFVEIK